MRLARSLLDQLLYLDLRCYTSDLLRIVVILSSPENESYFWVSCGERPEEGRTRSIFEKFVGQRSIFVAEKASSRARTDNHTLLTVVTRSFFIIYQNGIVVRPLRRVLLTRRAQG